MDRLKRIDVRARLVAQAGEIFAGFSQPELAALAGALLDGLSTPGLFALVSRLQSLRSGRGAIPPAVAEPEKKRFFLLTRGIELR